MPSCLLYLFWHFLDAFIARDSWNYWSDNLKQFRFVRFKISTRLHLRGVDFHVWPCVDLRNVFSKQKAEVRPPNFFFFKTISFLSSKIEKWIRLTQVKFGYLARRTISTHDASWIFLRVLYEFFLNEVANKWNSQTSCQTHIQESMAKVIMFTRACELLQLSNSSIFEKKKS